MQEDRKRPRVAVVHLVRAANGLSTFQRFVESYRRHPAGMRHDLILLFKGFADRGDASHYVTALGELEPQALYVNDYGFDIGAYRKAARRLPHEYLCLLNSFSEVLVEGWLSLMFAHAVRPDVGVVAATASYESLYTTLLSSEPPSRGPYSRARAMLRRRVFRRAFPPFPNPHVRTNGLLMTRTRLLQVPAPLLFARKLDAARFESGRKGLTAFVLAAGLKPVVVGGDGRGYEITAWPTSRTYADGDQQNLMIEDNRTRLFRESPAEGRAAISRAAWGTSTGADLGPVV